LYIQLLELISKKAAVPIREVDEMEQLFSWGTHKHNSLIVKLPPDCTGLHS
jgi:hypothetical protein